MSKIIYNNLSREDLARQMQILNIQKFRGNQIFEGIHNLLYNNFGSFTNLSKDLKDCLNKNGKILQIELLDKFSSKFDSTTKYLFELEDGALIETVLMKYPNRNTLCISSQVGCKMGCKFCASTKAGYERDLQVAELLEQVYFVSRFENLKINNVVLMGIGEPLDNYENVVKFIRLITDERGYNLSIRNITLSTCGLAHKMDMLAEENLPINLTISLHNPFDEERSKIMPVNIKYSIDDIMKSAKNYFDKTGRRVSFEYTLIKGINDSKRHIEELERLFKGGNFHLNLIPLNAIDEFGKPSTDYKDLESFKNKLVKRGINTTIRKSMGKDIEGACGQLRSQRNKK
ncbi:23S rRNA (adenine(2503)-C(2))-methyltransferase RlmN [Lagierella sp.]|uniref:23S rRNA (adenine(2503)-C(2))-methyltransferase RlmN n=1 Tax=Lagierella sp. TaxID=2849657 RepID=UPI002638F0EB|nr:23S rRNA (adenine(2503)-C(2))-methyltransferase RlmN [Lagierella sp.]